MKKRKRNRALEAFKKEAEPNQPLCRCELYDEYFGHEENCPIAQIKKGDNYK